MKSYSVEIKETLQMTVEVKADSREQAEEMVSDQWKKSEHILDSDHFKDVSFTAKCVQKTKDNER